MTKQSSKIYNFTDFKTQRKPHSETLYIAESKRKRKILKCLEKNYIYQKNGTTIQMIVDLSFKTIKARGQ